MMTVGVWRSHREVVASRLDQAVGMLSDKGIMTRVTERVDGSYTFFVYELGPADGPADPGSPASAWAPILRSHLAGLLADAVLGPLTDRWLARFLATEARRRRYDLSAARRARALQLARQLVEGPDAGDGANGGMTPPATAPPAGTAGQGRTGATNLARWHARVARQILESLTERPDGLVLEGIVWFRLGTYVQALRRAAAAAVGELAAEREEQRSTGPWRSLWLGPPPRIYEVHVLRGSAGKLRIVDRWGMPATRRYPGDTSASDSFTEEVAVAQLVRLNPRRILIHLPDEATIQSAVRAAFPGRVHTCRGCPRCSARQAASTPSPSPTPAPAH